MRQHPVHPGGVSERVLRVFHDDRHVVTAADTRGRYLFLKCYRKLRSNLNFEKIDLEDLETSTTRPGDLKKEKPFNRVRVLSYICYVHR